MRESTARVCAMVLLIAVVQLSCAVPRMVWPQKNIDEYESADPSMESRVLIASRSSEFKDTIVSRLRTALEGEHVYVKLIGLDDLKGEDGKRYDAVVIINTCIAWGLDPKVSGFLNRQEDHSNIIVLTTSGDGDWLPDKKGRDFDAISSASKMADADALAATITAKIDDLLGN